MNAAPRLSLGAAFVLYRKQKGDYEKMICFMLGDALPTSMVACPPASDSSEKQVENPKKMNCLRSDKPLRCSSPQACSR